jgi:hypothetical protein
VTAAGTPAEVRRFVRRPLDYAFLLLVLVCTLWGLARRDSLREDDDYARGFSVAVRVAPSYDGSDLVPVAYRHPLTGMTRTEIGLWSADPPEPGSAVPALADRNDPRDVLLVGDDYPVTTLAELGLGVGLALTPVVTVVLRRSAVRQLGRLMASDRPTYSLLGSISGAWPDGRRARLQLYPADARPGIPPLCSIPLLTSYGLPAGGAFPVEAKGSPRPLGRVAVRHGADVLWPRGRASSRTASEPMPAPIGVPTPFLPTDARPAVFVGSWLRYAGRGLAVAAGALGLVAVSTGITLVHWAQARDLERHGVEVIAEVIEADAGAYTLGVAYSLPNVPARREGRAAVDFPEDWDVGDRYPAVVDPDAPGRLRLLTEPYDPLAPLVWSALPAAVVVPWIVWSARRWRRQKQAAGGPWATAESWVIGNRTSPTYGRVLELAVARPGSTEPSCLIRVPPGAWIDGRQWVHGRLDVSDMTAVGDPLVVRAGDCVYAAVRAARTPRRT